ncbi:uncharacterized protein LOC143593022 [Bidens hawaiensis]|uniref:uncharacterized protein LOC143593022 n=1 Tax=Bidens hawaiensis TaxID=980011 RepID=UPI00404B0685
MASPAPAKSQPLHNFSLPHLKWRNHRTGRNKLAGDTSSSSPTSHHTHQSSAYVSRRSESESEQNGVVRSINPSKKILTKVIKPMDNSKGKRTNNNKICIRIRKNDVKHDVTEENQQNDVVQSIEEDDTSPKIWNLRPRRPLISHKQNNISSLTLQENRYYYSQECNNNQTNKEVLEGKTKSNEYSMQMMSRKKNNNKLSISLSKDEIEEDMFALTGAKPSRRPKKRPRTIQRQLDTLFPGLWLGSITADTYKVSEARSKI